jgi:PRTRC genetic system protein F
VFTGDAAGSGQLKTCALALADAGILRPEHMDHLQVHGQHKPNQTLAATFKAETEPAAKHLIEAALADVARRARPNPRVKLAVTLAGEVSALDAGCDLRCNERKGGLLVACDSSNPIHLEIGPNIQRLENRHPGLGQTALYWLSEGLGTTVRACDPRTAIHWASHNYWRGENDESEWLGEQLDDLEHYHQERQAKLPEAQRTPFSREAAIKEIGLFTRADLDKELPKAICSGKPKLTRRRLIELRNHTTSPIIRIIDAILKVMAHRPNESRHTALKNDLGLIECTSWFVCPYLLRWCRSGRGDWHKVQDSLGMFWDDYMNNEFQAGETSLTANSAFLWDSNPKSMVDAFRRFEAWCRALQAAENLLTAIQPREID